MPSAVSGQQSDRSLEEYLASDFRIDQQDITTLEQTLFRVQNTFNRTFAINQWPYEIQTEEVAVSEPDSFSQGTAAMVLGAAGKLTGICTPSLKSSADTSGLKKHWKKASTALLKDLRKTEESYEGAGPANIRSSSFGNNNAMTASHLAELVASLGSAEPSLTQSIKTFLDPVSDTLSATLVSEKFEQLMRPPKIRGAVQPSAFVPLRAIKACVLKFDPKLAFSNLRSVFEGGLHDQLSFSAIPDSRFDPAELLFCLEGLLLCAPESVDPALFDRVLAVLADKQNTSAHWRPNKPFVASATGSIMLPLSVEGANSLRRA